MLEVDDKYKILDGYTLTKKDIIAIKQFIKRNSRKGIISTGEKIINFFQKRTNRKENETYRTILSSIATEDSKNNYFAICQNLQIDYNRIMYLFSKGYDKRKTIIYTWFYYDKVNSKNKKVLSSKKLKMLENKTYLTDSTSIIDFIVSYKTGEKSAYNRIFELETTYYTQIIKKKLSKFNIMYTKDIRDEILGECFIFQGKVIDKVILSENVRVKKYISKYMTNHILDYIYKNYYRKNLEIDNFLNFNLDKEADYFQNPLVLLINNQEKDCLNKALQSLSKEDQIHVYDLYFTDKPPSLNDILTGEVNGYDIHDAVGRFQEKFLNLYEG